jgi:hypothetical protein
MLGCYESCSCAGSCCCCRGFAACMAAANDNHIVGSVDMSDMCDRGSAAIRFSYCDVPETVANVLCLRLNDRTRGAWPQSCRARWGTSLCILLRVWGCGGAAQVVLQKVGMNAGVRWFAANATKLVLEYVMYGKQQNLIHIINWRRLV